MSGFHHEAVFYPGDDEYVSDRVAELLREFVLEPAVPA
jgi:hypothetical protein